MQDHCETCYGLSKFLKLGTKSIEAENKQLSQGDVRLRVSTLVWQAKEMVWSPGLLLGVFAIDHIAVCGK